MRILLTGAASPLGRVVARLLIQRGHVVVGMARRFDGLKALEQLGAEAVQGDVRRADNVLRAMSGCDAVIHVAAFFDFWEPARGTYETVNVGATRNVIAAARHEGARRLLLCSSAITIGERSGALGDEFTRHRGHTHTALERSRIDAERLAMHARKKGLEVVIVNPGLVVAPDDAGWVGRLLLRVAAGERPFTSRAPLGWIWVEDAARGVVKAFEEGTDGARYILNGETMSSHRLLSLLAATIGAKAPRVLPPKLTLAEAALRTVIARPLGRRPHLAMDEARFLSTGFAVDGTFARHELGIEYTPASRYIPQVARQYAVAARRSDPGGRA